MNIAGKIESASVDLSTNLKLLCMVVEDMERQCVAERKANNPIISAGLLKKVWEDYMPCFNMLLNGLMDVEDSIRGEIEAALAVQG